ncbi:MAG: hypothetical protein AB9873_07140 [Syntrophobacteraceae bacterium]
MDHAELIPIASELLLFLEVDYGFVRDPDALVYRRDWLELECWLDRGECDIFFFVRRDDDIFRPYISRMFQLNEIVRRQVKSWPPSGIDLREMPLTREKLEAHFKWEAQRLKRFARPILEGDISLLGKIHLERRGVRA